MLTEPDDPFSHNMPPCRTCKFFQPMIKDAVPVLGQCRVDHPQTFILIKPAKVQQIARPGQMTAEIEFPSAWPVVPEDAWCGRHKPKASVVH